MEGRYAPTSPVLRANDEDETTEIKVTLDRDWCGNYDVSIGFTADRRHVISHSTHDKALRQRDQITHLNGRDVSNHPHDSVVRVIRSRNSNAITAVRYPKGDRRRKYELLNEAVMISAQRLEKMAAAARSRATSVVSPTQQPMQTAESPGPVPFAVPGHSPATGTSEPSERNIQWGEAASPTRSAVSTASPARHTVTKAVTRHTTDLGELETENARLREVVSEVESSRDAMFATVALVHSMAAETQRQLTAKLEEQDRAASTEHQQLRAQIAALKDENARIMKKNEDADPLRKKQTEVGIITQCTKPVNAATPNLDRLRRSMAAVDSTGATANTKPAATASVPTKKPAPKWGPAAETVAAGASVPAKKPKPKSKWGDPMAKKAAAKAAEQERTRAKLETAKQRILDRRKVEAAKQAALDKATEAQNAAAAEKNADAAQEAAAAKAAEHEGMAMNLQNMTAAEAKMNRSSIPKS